MILALDGGNTKTIALVLTRDGAIRGAARAGCGDIYGHGPAPALIEIDRAIAAACAQAGTAPARLTAAGISLAGMDWPEDFAFMRSELVARGLTRVALSNDAIGALRAGSLGGVGVSIVCGTGTAIGARNAAGETWHGGWWTMYVGAGSHQLGAAAFHAILRAQLGAGPSTGLTAAALALTGDADVEALLRHYSGVGTNHHTRDAAVRLPLRALAAVALEQANAGDAVALGLVRAMAADLGRSALAGARQVRLNAPFDLVLAGGMLRTRCAAFEDAIASELPGARVVVSQAEPVIGAALMGLEAAGVAVTPEIRARLAATAPGRELFATAG